MEDKGLRMANIICHAIETVAVCTVIAILGCRMLVTFEKSIVKSNTDPRPIMEQSQKGGR